MPVLHFEFFGDSIVRGETTDNYLTKSYAAKTALHFGATWVNHGSSGAIVDPGAGLNPSGTGFDLVDLYTLAETGNYAPGNYVYVAYGTNDYAGGYGSVPPGPWITRYLELISLIIDFGYSPGQIIVGTAPYQSARNTPPFAAALEEMCDENGFLFFNAYEYTQTRGGDSLLVDGIHPGETGHGIIADGLIAMLEASLIPVINIVPGYNVVVATETIPFEDAGINSTNTTIIFLLDGDLKSYVPGRSINPITGFEAQKGYYYIAKEAIDLTAYVVPPLPE